MQKTLSGGGYNLSRGYMGLKVWYVQRKLGLSGRRAIMDSTTINAVRNYQRRNGLSATGVVDLATWKRWDIPSLHGIILEHTQVL